jgi:hypothetical protein
MSNPLRKSIDRQQRRETLDSLAEKGLIRRHRRHVNWIRFVRREKILALRRTGVLPQEGS